MALSKDEVKKIAHLARLELTDSELEMFAGQLSAILDHAEMLKEVDTKNVEPISQITGLKNITFEDKVKTCEIQSKLLKESPQEIQNNMTKVKSVFE